MASLKILHVDDDPEITTITKLLLSRQAPGVKIATASSGQEVLEYLGREQVDCILSDYQMPGMDGMELLDRVRERTPRLPFIFLTGQGNEEVASEAFKHGANDYFTKDVGFAHFTRLINSIEQAVKQSAAVEARARAEKEWEDTFNAISESITIQSTDFTVLRANRSTCEMLGMSQDEIVGRKCHQLFHGLGYPMEGCPAVEMMRCDAGILAASVTGKGSSLMFTGEFPAGGRVYEFDVCPLVKDGKLRAFVHLAKDVTGRKMAEAAVVKSNEMLAAVVNSIQFGVMLIGTDRRIRHANPAALRMLGVEDMGDIVGNICHKTICPAETNKCPVLDLGMKVDMSEKTLIDARGGMIPIIKSVGIINISGEDVLLETFFRARDADRQAA
ncbi:MAG: response regulator [Nitrospirae bacterium]|nr:response regulator [Nitrospirota bacterium]MBI5695648.1 response regulator [Nitrospirota bacterium]